MQKLSRLITRKNKLNDKFSLNFANKQNYKRFVTNYKAMQYAAISVNCNNNATWLGLFSALLGTKMSTSDFDHFSALLKKVLMCFSFLYLF